MKFKALGALVLLLVAASGAAAQETTGRIEGRIADAQDLALPGATVTVTGPQGERSVTTNSEGRFSVPFLTPGEYAVKAELQGFKVVEQKNVLVRLGLATQVALALEVGGIAETVEVTGGSTVVDTSSTTVGANLDSSLFQQVPVGRRLSETLYLAPGVSSSGDAGAANPSMAGGSGLENQYVVDGVNITNSGYGALGSYSIIFGSLGNGVNFDFIKEVQVKTGGYEAEYGQATGGVVNVITKSGSNIFSGSAFGYFRPQGLEGDFKQVVSDSLSRPEAVNRTGTQFNDVGFQGGGPIVHDRAFFFGAINPQWETETFIAPSNAPLSAVGEQDRKRQITSYALKGTFQPRANHRLETSFFGDPATGDEGPQRRSALLRDQLLNGFSELKYGGHNQVVKYDGVMGSNWLLEASFSRAQNRIRETPTVDAWNVTDNTTDVALRSGGIGLIEDNDGTNLQYQAKSTHILGDHQLRYGVLYEDIKYDNIIDRTGPSFLSSNGRQTITGAEITILPDPNFGRIYRVTRGNFSTVRETDQQYFNFFVQDTWKVGNRLTIRPGIRYEQQKLVGNLDEFKWDGNWAPRIGGTYDVLGNGKSKIYASWGRFFAKVPNDLAARALSADDGLTRDDFFDAGLTQPVPEGVSAAGTTRHNVAAGLSASEFDADAKSTYLDESLVGFEYEAFPGLNLGVRYVHRSFGRILEDVGLAPMVAYFVLPSSQLASVEYFITNPDEGTEVQLSQAPGTSFEKAIHDYNAVEFTADKRFADRWQLQASYRWSRLNGTFEGFYRNDNGQSDPAISSLFDFPTNDPSYTSIGVPEFGFRGDIRFLGELGAGPLPNDRPHQVKLFGNYAFDFGLNLGLGFDIGSGRPLTALAANPVYDSDGEIPETPRGEGFETEDGFRTRAEVESNINFQASYGVPVGQNRRLVLLADVFNLFDQQAVVKYDDGTEQSFLVANPDFGRALIYQFPRRIRLGLRFEF